MRNMPTTIALVLAFIIGALTSSAILPTRAATPVVEMTEQEFNAAVDARVKALLTAGIENAVFQHLEANASGTPTTQITPEGFRVNGQMFAGNGLVPITALEGNSSEDMAAKMSELVDAVNLGRTASLH